MRDPSATYPLITRDPVTGDELLVTRLEGVTSGISIEGHFHFGWLGRLTAVQLEFVRLLALHRGNIQKVAAELGIAYNTARTRSDEIATALSTPGSVAATGQDNISEDFTRSARLAVLDQVYDGTLSVDDALGKLKNVSLG